MPTLDIRFINEPDIVSRLITWETNSLWCHVEALSEDRKSWIGAHAGTGVEARSLDWCKPTREAVYAIPVTEEGASAANTWLRSQIGTPYNCAAIFGLAVHARVGLSRHEVICSALMLEYLWRAHLQPLNVVKGYESLITPETLHLSPLLIEHCTYKL